MKHPQPAPITTWATEPVILSAERVAQIFGWSRRALMRRVYQCRFPPPMFSNPARWSRNDLERAWHDGRFGATKPHVRRSA
jgi:hypothetical protein